MYRPKTDEELEAEAIQAQAAAADAPAPKPKAAPAAAATAGEEKKSEALKEIDRREIVLTEVRLLRKVEKGLEDVQPAEPPKEAQESPEKEPQAPGEAKEKPAPEKTEPAKTEPAKAPIPAEPARRKPPSPPAPLPKRPRGERTTRSTAASFAFRCPWRKPSRRWAAMTSFRPCRAT